MDELAGVALATYRSLVWDDPAFPAFFRSLHTRRRAGAARDRLPARVAPRGRRCGRARGAPRDPLGLRVDAEPLPAARVVRLWLGVPRVRARRRAARLAPAALRRVAVLPRARREPRDDARQVELRDRRVVRLARAGRASIAIGSGRRCRPSIGERWKRCSRSSRRDELLDRHPVVQRSIRLRNPYVDPMNAIQVELLRAWRGGRRGRAAAAAPLDRRASLRRCGTPGRTTKAAAGLVSPDERCA